MRIIGLWLICCSIYATVLGEPLVAIAFASVAWALDRWHRANLRTRKETKHER